MCEWLESDKVQKDNKVEELHKALRQTTKKMDESIRTHELEIIRMNITRAN